MRTINYITFFKLQFITFNQNKTVSLSFLLDDSRLQILVTQVLLQVFDKSEFKIAI